jgi:hypothetical protein
LQALPIGSAGPPRTITSISSSFSTQLLGSSLYVNLLKFNSTPTYSITYSTESVAIDGTVLQPATDSTSFLYSSSDELIQVRGITDPSGLGGGVLYATDTSAATPNPVRVTLADASAFQLPTQTGSMSLTPLAGSIETGAFSTYPATTAALMYDRSSHVIAVISMPYTNVSPVVISF